MKKSRNFRSPKKTVAIYARVSSQRQKEEGTIDSQIATLTQYAENHELEIPDGWTFTDEGVSGAIFQRPGLDALRDLAVAGGPDAILVLQPDRLARKYAYQVLLLEEFEKASIEVIFCKNKRAETPEEHLMEQFQGMFAEYERAQIAERCRRGRLHKAKQGALTVIAQAPFGYRYVRDEGSNVARYEIHAQESEIVRSIFHMYSSKGLGIKDICNHLDQSGVTPRRSKNGWDPTTIRTMLRNQAYIGRANFGKTEKCEGNSQRIVRGPKAGRMRVSQSARRQRPEEDWITIPVPAIVLNSIFDLTQEKLDRAQRFAARNTKKPSILQGLLVCGRCGASYYKKARSSEYTYYCCHRKLVKSDETCINRSVRQKDLDTYVWDWIVSLLKDPKLVAVEIQRRLSEDPELVQQKRIEKELQRELQRLASSRNKLLDAYTHGECLELEELHKRMLPLNQNIRRIDRELRGMKDRASTEEAIKQGQLTLEGFAERLQQSSEELTVEDKQRVVRSLIDEIVIEPEAIRIKHCIPIAGKMANKRQNCPLEGYRCNLA